MSPVASSIAAGTSRSSTRGVLRSSATARRRSAPAGSQAELPNDFFGQPQVGLGDRGFRLGHDDRPPRVAADRDFRIERDLAEEGNAQLFGRAPSAAVLEDLLAVPALRTH